MAKVLPPRPRLGRRERWLTVACILVVGEGVAGHFGFAAPTEHMSLLLGAVIAFIGGDTFRASGTSRESAEP